MTSYGIATGSGEIRLELVERRQLHAKAAADSARRRAAGAHAWPARTPAAAATSPQTVVQAQAEAPLLEPPVLELAPEMIRPSLEDEARKAEVPNTPEAATALQRPAPRTATPARAQHVEPPPPSVFVKAPPAPARKREPTEAFRSSYQQGPR